MMIRVDVSGEAKESVEMISRLALYSLFSIDDFYHGQLRETVLRGEDE